MYPDHDAMTEACIKAAESVKRSGSSELQAVMRVLLYVLAGEMAERAGLRPKPDEQAANGEEKH